ncbi:OTU-like cysteine protease, partial [Ancylostoma ceylanicum]
TTFKPRRRRNFNRESRPEHARRGSVSPGANSGDEYDVGFKDEKMDADFALLLKRTRGFEIRHVRGDGSCMFRAVADQLYGDQEMHGEVRRLCMDYMVRNRDHFAPFVAEDFSSYVARKRRPGQHGNHVELQAISEMFARPIEIYEYSEMVDPFAPAVGVGLGLPGYVARGANDLRQAVKESSDRSVEQALVQSQIALTDMERTEREISEQVARDSYLDYLARQAGEEQSSQKSSLYAELLALEG